MYTILYLLLLVSLQMCIFSYFLVFFFCKSNKIHFISNLLSLLSGSSYIHTMYTNFRIYNCNVVQIDFCKNFWIVSFYIFPHICGIEDTNNEIVYHLYYHYIFTVHMQLVSFYQTLSSTLILNQSWLNTLYPFHSFFLSFTIHR